MGTEINPNPPTYQPVEQVRSTEPSKSPPEEAAKTQKPEAPPKTDLGAMSASMEGVKTQYKTESLPPQFINVVSSIIKEGYEDYSPPPIDQSAGVYADNLAQNFQKDLQVIHEFLRQAKYLIDGQNMDVAQMLHFLKSQQGGILWQKFQQILQRGLPVQEALLMQKLDKEAMGLREKMLGAQAGEIGEAAEKAARLTQQTPGRALLEMFKAETNPKAQLENFLLALQMLKQDGMRNSSDKLVSYLRSRWGFSEKEMRRFLAQQQIAYFQGPMPMEERKSASPWWVLIAFLVIPIALAAGLNLLEAGAIAGALAIAILIFHVQKK